MRETFEKRSILFNAKKGEKFNHRHTLSISRINPPKFGGGLKFETDAGIGPRLNIKYGFNWAGKRGRFSKVSEVGTRTQNYRQ